MKLDFIIGTHHFFPPLLRSEMGKVFWIDSENLFSAVKFSDVKRKGATTTRKYLSSLNNCLIE